MPGRKRPRNPIHRRPQVVGGPLVPPAAPFILGARLIANAARSLKGNKTAQAAGTSPLDKISGGRTVLGYEPARPAPPRRKRTVRVTKAAVARRPARKAAPKKAASRRRTTRAY